MRNTLSVILATAVLLTSSVRAQYYIYTNVPSGSTVSLTNSVEVSPPSTNQAETVGIAFGSGSGDGTLSGNGDFTVSNTADAGSYGGTNLIGIQAATLTNSYTGAVTVNHDLSAYTLDLEGAAYGYDTDIYGNLDGAVTVTIKGPTYNDTGSAKDTENNSTAVGINGNISSNLNASVTATATGGSSYGSSSSEQNARASAYGITGNVGGDVSAAVSAYAEAREASGDIGRAPGEASAIVGNVGGSVDADITAIAVAGTATGTASFAYTVATASGIGGSVSNDVTGTVTVAAQGGNAWAGGIQTAFANAEATGITGEVGGDISGQIRVIAAGGTAINTGTGGETADATATGIDSSGVPVSRMTLAGGSIMASATAGTVGGITNGAEATAIGISADTLSMEMRSGAVSADATGSNAAATAISANSLSLEMSSGTILADAAGSGAAATAISVTSLSMTNSGTVAAGATGSNASATGILADSLSLEMSPGTILADAAGSDAIATAISADSLSMTNSGTISATATGTNATATAIQAATMDIHMDAGSLTALENGSAGRAISAGSGSVYFGNVDVVGSVGTLDLLSVYGQASIYGDISATDTTIENGGSLTFINEQAVMTGNLAVQSNAILSVVLTPADTNSTALSVTGSVTVEDTGKLNVAVPQGTDSQSVIGKSYRAVGTPSASGEFEEAPSLYTFSMTNLADGVWITIDGVAQQVGASTPAVANSLVSLSRTTLGMMADLSSRLEGVRSALRDPASIAAPIGAAGPDQAGSGEWTAYLHQVNHRGEQDDENGVDGYSFNSHGFMLGAEKVFNEHTLLGANAGYFYTGFDGNVSEQKGSSGLFPVNLYGDWVMDAWHWGAGLTLAASTSDTKRRDSGGEYYSGEFDSSYLGGWMDGSCVFGSESVKYEPYARTAYLNSQHDGYTDSGGGAPLSVGDNTVENWVTEIGLKVSKTWHRKNKKDEFELSVKAGWLQEWMDNQVIIDNATLGGIPQVFESTESSDSALVLAITENWFASDQWALGLTYKPVISENWYYHSFSVNLDYTF